MSKAQTLTTADLTTIFGVSHMTIHNWKKGTPTKDPLPTVETGTRNVLFPVAGIKRWAKVEGVAIVVDPDKLLAKPAQRKPGPKPRGKAH